MTPWTDRYEGEEVRVTAPHNTFDGWLLPDERIFVVTVPRHVGPLRHVRVRCGASSVDAWVPDTILSPAPAGLASTCLRARSEQHTYEPPCESSTTVEDRWPRYYSGAIMWREDDGWPPRLVGCPLCGAAVWDTETHVEWHESNG